MNNNTNSGILINAFNHVLWRQDEKTGEYYTVVDDVKDGLGCSKDRETSFAHFIDRLDVYERRRMNRRKEVK